MAKNRLVGGSLWEEYSNKVNERMQNPRYRGELTEADAKKAGGKLIVADWGAEACGDTVRLFWIVDEATHRIIDARFKSFGCGTAIASSDVMAELCIGKTVDEVLKITNLDVEFAMRDTPEVPAVPPQKMHCSVMAYDVIKKAVALYRGVELSSLEGEEIVCDCAQVSLKTIKEVIKLNDLHTVEEITAYTKAGAFCKSCIRPGGHENKKYYLEDILRETRNEMEAEAAASQPPSELTFSQMTVVQKLKAIERVLNSEVRPFLSRDKGDVEVVDLQEAEGKTRLFLKYSGACSACAASGATLAFIEEQLQDLADPSIEVIQV